jgi:RNA polymerase sigma factor (sigma-70 family)
MPGSRTKLVFNQLYRMAGAHPLQELSDGQLLARFASCRDEAAFDSLLQRHGSMVLHVCRRVLHRHQDAEDAFQGTFLLLAQKAGSILKQESLASWLYGVAYRLAIKSRARMARQEAREKRAGRMRQTQAGIKAAWDELQAALDEEMHRLPPKHQVPLVLCYFEGKTHEEIARLLGCPVGTVHSRVVRAREMLKRRLARRGLALPAAALATVLTANVASAVPAQLLSATCTAAIAHAAGKTIPAGLVTAEAAALANGGLTAMTPTYLKLGLAMLVALGVVAAGAGAMLSGLSPDKAPEAASASAPPKTEAAKSGDATPERRDRFGEPLPAEAVMRLGTVRKWPRPTQSGQNLTFTSDSKHVALVEADGVVVIRDAASGKETARVGKPQKKAPVPLALIFSADDKRVAVIETYTHIRVWDVKANKELNELTELGGIAPSCAFSADGKILIAPGRNGVVHRWDTGTWKKLPPCEGHTGPVNATVISPDGKTIASGSVDQTVRLWDAATGKLVRTVLKHRNQVLAVAFSPDGKQVASWGTDSAVRVWEAETGKDVRSWKYPPAELFGSRAAFLRFSPNGKTLTFGDSMLSGFRTVDVKSGAQVQQLAGRGPASLALSPNGKLAASGGTGQLIKVYDAASGDELPRWRGGHEAPVVAVAFAPDRKTLATASLDHTIRLWDTATGAELKKFTGHNGPVNHLCFSKDGKHLASASSDRYDWTVSWWDVAAGTEARQFPGHEHGVVAMDLSADGKRLTVISSGGKLRVWDTESGKKVREEASPGAGSAVFAPDGKTVVYMDMRSFLTRIWYTTKEGDGAIRDLPAAPGGGRYFPHPGVFSVDGRLLLLAATNEQMRLWDLSARKFLRTLDRTEGMIRAFPPTRAALGAFSPDSRMLAVPSKGGAVALVELATSKVRHIFRGEQGIVTVLAFAPDGTGLLSGGDDGSALVWEISPAKQPKVELTDKQLDGLWADLAGADAIKAYAAVRALTASPKQAVPFLRKQQRPVETSDLKEIEQLIAELGSEKFAERKKAEEELAKLRHKAKLAMLRALAEKPSLDVTQRLQRLLGALADAPLPPDEVRALRAVEAMEAAGTGEAKKLIEEWAKGASQAVLTEEAKASLARLASHR